MSKPSAFGFHGSRKLHFNNLQCCSLSVYIKARPVLLLFGSYFPLFSQSCFVEECRPEPAVCPIPAQLCWSNAPVPDMLAPASRRHPFTPTRTPLFGRQPALPRPAAEGRAAEALRDPIGGSVLSLTDTASSLLPCAVILRETSVKTFPNSRKRATMSTQQHELDKSWRKKHQENDFHRLSNKRLFINTWRSKYFTLLTQSAPLNFDF